MLWKKLSYVITYHKLKKKDTILLYYTSYIPFISE